MGRTTNKPLGIPAGAQLAAGAAARTVRPYDIITSDNGEDVEIIMYGEVVESIPRDFWTGEKVDGLFISLSDFLDDIRGLDGKNVTVRINSVGGDLEAGVAIYNRLREIGNVTTVVDGMAASAASIIAQGGETRKVYRSSQLMVHSAAVMVIDYVNINMVNEIRSMLESANKQILAVYAERSGLSETRLKHMIEDTTWMVGQEIVDAGLADEVIDEEGPQDADHGGADMAAANAAAMRLSAGYGIRIPGGYAGMVPHNAAKHTGRVPDVINQSEEVKVMTVEELKNQYPEAVSRIEDAARESVDTGTMVEDAVKAERKRIEDIESIEGSVKDKDLVREAKYGEHPMDAKDLALMAMQKQAREEAETVQAFLADSARDAEDSGAGNVEADPGGEEQQEAKDIAVAVGAINAMKKGARA